METQLETLRGRLIVSCQALEDEPLYSSFIMGRMAKAALEGGAAGIRANTVEDIEEIRKNVSIPVIGIIKEVYDNSEVYITPTLKEVDKLMEIKPEIIAVDATKRIRPDGSSIVEFFSKVKEKYPDQKFMADCSNVEEALIADELGFDFIGTTLVGYTDYSAGDRIEENDFEIIRKILKQVHHPVIAEGNIDLPIKAKRVIELGCFSVVVGGAITRPQLITKKFTKALQEGEIEL